MLPAKKYTRIAMAFVPLAFSACKLPSLATRNENKSVPAAYSAAKDSTNAATSKWRDFFSDPYLSALIDTALKNNQELNITLQEIEIARNEVRVRKGEYLPFLGLKAGAGADKVARYTNIGAMEATTEIKPGKEMPEPLPDYLLAAHTSWEVDIWHKLRNAKKAAVNRYLASTEGKNYVVTNLVAEVANSYFELLILDNQLSIVQKNIELQSNALRIVKLQKEAAKVTELAVRKFEAEVLKTKSLQYSIQQEIVETENRINFLLGRFPMHIPRAENGIDNVVIKNVSAGIPSQLLSNRPDIRRTEQELAAAKLDVKVAKAQFYPALSINAAVGFQAFNPTYLIDPASLLYSLAGDLMAPLVNRNAIKAAYYTANAKQLQAVYNYERTILNGYVEVANQVSRMDNLEKSYNLKSQQVTALTSAISISNDLFSSARADYMEILMTQRDALEARFELTETRKQQINAMVSIYKALGGGWN
jgi:NodT family efflux transporter outer membrane factor (OMF) lipoprotein